MRCIFTTYFILRILSFPFSGRGYNLKCIISNAEQEFPYTPSELKSHGIDYIHIPSPMKGVPSKETTHAFHQSLTNVIDSLNEDDIVGICCEDGFNKTGFFITKYLYDICQNDIDYSVNRFISANEPGIINGLLLDEIYSSCNEPDHPRRLDPIKPYFLDEREFKFINRTRKIDIGRVVRAPDINPIEGINPTSTPTTSEPVLVKVPVKESHNVENTPPIKKQRIEQIPSSSFAQVTKKSSITSLKSFQNQLIPISEEELPKFKSELEAIFVANHASCWSENTEGKSYASYLSTVDSFSLLRSLFLSTQGPVRRSNSELPLQELQTMVVSWKTCYPAVTWRSGIEALLVLLPSGAFLYHLEMESLALTGNGSSPCSWDDIQITNEGLFRIPHLSFYYRKQPDRKISNSVVVASIFEDETDNKAIPRLLVQDVVYFNNALVKDLPISTRNMMANVEFVVPWQKNAEKLPNGPQYVIRVRHRPIYQTNDLQKLQKTIASVDHPISGLMFMGQNLSVFSQGKCFSDFRTIEFHTFRTNLSRDHILKI